MGTQRVTTRTIHTIEVTLDDAIIDEIRDSDQVEVIFLSRAMNRQMTPIRLSWSALERLTKDK